MVGDSLTTVVCLASEGYNLKQTLLIKTCWYRADHLNQEVTLLSQDCDAKAMPVVKMSWSGRYQLWLQEFGHTSPACELINASHEYEILIFKWWNAIGLDWFESSTPVFFFLIQSTSVNKTHNNSNPLSPFPFPYCHIPGGTMDYSWGPLWAPPENLESVTSDIFCLIHDVSLCDDLDC